MGHEVDQDEFGATLLIGSHNNPVVNPVWELYQYTLKKSGPRPTLIEWDSDIPEWSGLLSEVTTAHGFLAPHLAVAAE